MLKVKKVLLFRFLSPVLSASSHDRMKQKPSVLGVKVQIFRNTMARNALKKFKNDRHARLGKRCAKRAIPAENLRPESRWHDASRFPTCGKVPRNTMRLALPRMGKQTPAKYPAKAIQEMCFRYIISHDVFLWTLSRVINSFITRDKALRGTLCNSTECSTRLISTCKGTKRREQNKENLPFFLCK